MTPQTAVIVGVGGLSVIGFTLLLSVLRDISDKIWGGDLEFFGPDSDFRIAEGFSQEPVAMETGDGNWVEATEPDDVLAVGWISKFPVSQPDAYRWVTSCLGNYPRGTDWGYVPRFNYRSVDGWIEWTNVAGVSTPMGLYDDIIEVNEMNTWRLKVRKGLFALVAWINWREQYLEDGELFYFGEAYDDNRAWAELFIKNYNQIHYPDSVQNGFLQVWGQYKYDRNGDRRDKSDPDYVDCITTPGAPFQTGNGSTAWTRAIKRITYVWYEGARTYGLYAYNDEDTPEVFN